MSSHLISSFQSCLPYFVTMLSRDAQQIFLNGDRPGNIISLIKISRRILMNHDAWHEI